jgi:glycosyltransferase involved in cell wall biosynthesis
LISFSTIIITHGREELLWKCLDSLRPECESWQLIIVANGKKLSDSVESFARSLAPVVEIIELQDRQTPGKARNLALEKVLFDWVFFIDDDAYVLENYFKIVAPVLEKSTVDVLGGPDSPARGMSRFSLALALALSSPFCSGMTYSRHRSMGGRIQAASEEILTSCNLWIRTALIQGRPFPEDFKRAEETYVLLNLQQQGAHLFYHPALRVGHHRRQFFREIISPTFQAGRYRAKLIKEKRGSSLFYLLPAVFVGLHLMIFLDLNVFIMMMRLYLGVIVLMSLNLSLGHRRGSLVIEIALLHYVIVFLYGCGTIFQWARWYRDE